MDRPFNVQVVADREALFDDYRKKYRYLQIGKWNDKYPLLVKSN